MRVNGARRSATRPGRLVPLLAAGLLAGCVSLTPYEEVRRRHDPGDFVVVDGQSVFVEQAGAGEPLVLLHGFGGSAYTWRRVIPELAGAYRVIAVDLNGFGFTERPRSLESYTVTGQLDLVRGVLDALGLGRVHLAGHSYGGSLGLQMASRHPDRLRSLVLVDSAAADYPAARRHRLAGLSPLVWLYVRTLGLRRGRVVKGLRDSIHDPAMITDDLVAAYRERLRIEGASRAFRGLTRKLPAKEPEVDLAALRLPVLAIWGAEDRLIAASVARREVERIPGAEFVLLDETGHLPPEERPAQVARRMLDFLTRVSRR